MKKSKSVEVEKLLSEKELAEIVGLKPRFIKSAREKYNLNYYKIGKLVKLKLSDFVEWTEQRKVG